MDDGNAAETKLWKLIEDIRVAMLTTEAGGSLESRPMSAYVDKEERIIWFLTRIDSGKTGEIADDAHVNLAFANSKAHTFVSLSGKAKVVRDVVKQKELWGPFAEAWMPEGPEASTTALIRVEPAHGTYWDSPGKLATLFNVAKANITQTPPPSGDVAHVNL